MGKTTAYENLTEILNPHKEADKTWFLDLLDGEKQKIYEDGHISRRNENAENFAHSGT